VAIGALGKSHGLRVLLAPVLFGVFQGLMPLAGFLLGSAASSYAERFGNVIGFALLFLLSVKMFREALAPEEERDARSLTALPTLVALAFATSIDAFVVGITFAFAAVNSAVAAGIIAAITFVCCMVAFYVGRALKHAVSSHMEIAGAVVLLALAVKTLLF
jgi:putative Mn2+ efflux pump MntP